MYVIVVYDVQAGRTDKPRKLLRKHLTHVQNSVFEGEITEGNLEKLKKDLENIQKSNESIFVYELWGDNYVDRTILGEDPMDENRLI